MEIGASLNQYRQSPRKVRLVADLVRGKMVGEALNTLHFLPKRAGSVVEKLVRSAVASAEHNFKLSSDNLFVKKIAVDKGVTLKRFMPRAFGRGARIHKRSSHINLVLGVREVKTPKK